ncbi:MAG: DEAD/DEAH box helicase family protein [Candidatus Moeniiplasma glomeromycotorum]|nr:DEAD/DEAH box helicase family protein [Candidatus Moeniiplasma glomeromycotorum]
MSILNILKFQEEAVESLKEIFVELWKQQERQLPIIFKSPTGSGKTFMTSFFIRELNHLPQWKEDKAFIWITFSDNLVMQSKKKFLEYFQNTLENRVLTVEDIDQGKLYKNDILFLNWEKLLARNVETRRLRRPKEEELRKEKGEYFEDVIEQTKIEGREIILIIDEAHKNKDTKLAQDIIDLIDPKIILHVTATPKGDDELITRRLGSFYEVPRGEVVKQGLIKEAIITQTEEDFQNLSGKDLDENLLELGIKKREELKNGYYSLGKNINPLMLIQLPNDEKALVERGEQRKEEVVTEYLRKKGIPKYKIAKWFDKHPRPDGLENNDDEHEFLLFKYAAGTGWDCPRASVIVMFREIKSNIFYTQTLGRILRMPEPHLKEDYKNNPNLRVGYLYTNYKREEIKIPDESSQNKPLIKNAQIKKGIKNIKLLSDYLSYLDYGDIRVSAEFQKVFKREFNKYFEIENGDEPKKIEEKLIEKGLRLGDTFTKEIIINAQFEDYDNIAFDLAKQGRDIALEVSISDVEKTFNYLCWQVLREQEDEWAKYSNVARSWSVLKSAIRVWFKDIFPEKPYIYWYKIFIKDVLKYSESKLRPAITQALRKYKPISDELLEEKKKLEEQKESYIFTIQKEYGYTEDYEEVPQKLCVLDKFYLLKKYSGRENEISFMEYLEKKQGKINWWFKNGNYGKNYFGIKYMSSETKKESLFYPDWIIQFSDGQLGIFDTKAGRTAIGSETADKAKVLQEKLQEFREKHSKKFIGGIVVKENEIWYYNDSPNYSKGQSVNDNKDWKPFEDLFG